MVDASEPSGRSPERDGEDRPEAAAGTDPPDDAANPEAAGEPTPPATFQQKIEEKYDFAHFSPADMAEMTVEEWEAAFDPDSWITGPELLDRVEADLRSRVGRREVFAVVERTEVDGEACVLAYSDVDYALVRPDGSVEGEGALLEDVEPVVALCSMADYDVPEPPADAGLPHPDEVGEGAGGIGDRLLLAVAVVQVVAGLLLLLAPVFVDLNPGGPGGGAGLLTTVAGLGFLFIGLVIGVLVANARLSGRFRAEEYRRRLRAAGVGSDERPAFLPGGRLDGEVGEGHGGEGVDEAAGSDGDEAGPVDAVDAVDEPSESASE